MKVVLPRTEDYIVCVRLYCVTPTFLLLRRHLLRPSPLSTPLYPGVMCVFEKWSSGRGVGPSELSVYFTYEDYVKFLGR